MPSRRVVSTNTKNYPLQQVNNNKFERICLLLFVVSCAIKILLFSSYHSTDFDVHRHWKAVTRNLPLKEWYFDDEHVDTRHTLDYPPGFIWMEAFWAYSPLTKLLVLLKQNDDHDNGDEGEEEACLALLPDPADHSHQSLSNACVVYMRLTVVLSDILLWLGAYAVAKTTWTSLPKPSFTNEFSLFGPLALFMALVFQPALLWLDHVHFQYNGAMIGLWLLSMACLLRANQLQLHHQQERSLLLVGAVCFATLLMMKHLYLTLAPWYGVYLFSRYCIVVKSKKLKNDTNNNIKYTISWSRFVLLATVTLIALMIPILPFAWQYANTKSNGSPLTKTDERTLADWFLQVFRRLFPFGRGLVHDYWAGNVWAFYAAAQKLCRQCLPDVTPKHTAFLLVLFQLPGLRQAYQAAQLRCNDRLLTSMAYCGAMAFWVSFHVHEKAVLNALIPMTIWAWGSCRFVQSEQVDDKLVAAQQQKQRQKAAFKVWWECTAWGTLGVVPLLYEPREMLLKGASLMAYLATFYFIGCENQQPSAQIKSTMISRLVVHVPFRWHCIALLLVWIQVDMMPIRFFGRWEFAPLALTSLACATGLLVSFLRLSYHFWYVSVEIRTIAHVGRR